ncbi:hypothetical protein SUGI_0622690 [Cryptomeria japonica]|nr:hypothetical protein SUGI_0622690 [Cryptomeria japonica]
MSLRVALWVRVSSQRHSHAGFSLGRGAQSWVIVAKGGSAIFWLGVESKRARNDGSVAAQNWNGFDALNEGVRQGLGFQSHSRPLLENDRWVGGSDTRSALVWRKFYLLTRGVSHDTGNSALATTTLVPAAKSIFVIISEEFEKEVEKNEMVFAELGLIG